MEDLGGCITADYRLPPGQTDESEEPRVSARGMECACVFVGCHDYVYSSAC